MKSESEKFDDQTRRHFLCRLKSCCRFGTGRGKTCSVIQNNVGNRHSPTVICAAITSKMNKAKLPTHIEISTRDYKIVKNSVILLEQIRTIDKQRLKEYVCHIDSAMMQKVDKAIRISLEIAT